MIMYNVLYDNLSLLIYLDSSPQGRKTSKEPWLLQFAYLLYKASHRLWLQGQILSAHTLLWSTVHDTLYRVNMCMEETQAYVH